MNNLKLRKNQIITAMIIVIAVIVLFAFASTGKDQNQIDNVTNEGKETEEVSNLVVYLQDKDAALKSDCGITYPKNIQVSKTTAVADASLKYLFENELSEYGNYESVVVKDNVARVTISNDNDPSGLKISSLSSCESTHLRAVLEDTLTQYKTITSVELYSPLEKIEF